jgi:hypothetical protein
MSRQYEGGSMQNGKLPTDFYLLLTGFSAPKSL